MSQLVLWNNTIYSYTLAKYFGQKNVITSTRDYNEAIKNWSKYDCLIVLCELSWSGSNTALDMKQLKDIELVKELMIEYVILSVIFILFYSLEDIFNTQTEILTAVGHTFYQLPFLPQEI